MEPKPSQYDDFTTAQRVQSWADLFGFFIHMGRDKKPFVEVDGQRFESEEPDIALWYASRAMGMGVDYTMPEE